jgi:glucosamine--fructose-6-phosphate aminotransferase (isomerizing)
MEAVMCGIVGAVSRRDIVPVLIGALERLEYRGYDSAGIAVLDGCLKRIRSVGRVADMSRRVREQGLAGVIGIGHTRWATHGGVSEENAHPHISSNEIAVVHNGIIENHQQIRRMLESLGYRFESQTDTEVIAHLIHHELKQHGTLLRATQAAARQLDGTYAISVMSLKNPGIMVAARMGCPLLVGLGDGENFIASDTSALLAATRRMIYLEDGDVAELQDSVVSIVDLDGNPVSRAPHLTSITAADLQLGQYQHFMQKEIHEQPKALLETSQLVIQGKFAPQIFGEMAEELLRGVQSVLVLAAGTSYYAGLVARHWIEAIAGVQVTVEIASEYRYRASVPNAGQLVVTFSQSGETMDTLEALKHARALGQARTLSICNVPESAIPRSSAMVFYTKAGPEIGVASTKAFTTQLVAAFSLAVVLAKLAGRVTFEQEMQYCEALQKLPAQIQHALNLEPQVRAWAKHFALHDHALFLGRGVHYPIALEGALKLKEISYIHAEAYPAGELKHGPLALVDRNMPVVVIAPNDALLEKIKSNMQEVSARGGELFVFSDRDSEFVDADRVHVSQAVPHAGVLSPIVHAIPVQLLAYHTALLRGTDVDKPRNLAKAVTVE